MPSLPAILYFSNRTPILTQFLTGKSTSSLSKTINSKFRRIFHFTLLDRLMLSAHWLGVPSRRRINCLDLLNLAIRQFLRGFIRPWTWQLGRRCINLMRRRLGICFHSILQVSIPLCISPPFSLLSFLIVLFF